MRDYTELSKSVHCCVGCEESQCEICPRGDTPFSYIECKRKLSDDAADAIEELLAAVPKRGEWLITDAYPHRVYCSVCYKTYLPNADWELWSDGRIPRNFCPHCGAKMEVSEDA